MRRGRQWSACALAAAALALPASAWAQGAGDDQYTDPFGDEQEEAAPEPEQAPAPSEPEPAPAAPAPTATVSQTPSGEQQLPRTGADAGLLALTGTLLLASGVALRVRLSEPERRCR